MIIYSVKSGTKVINALVTAFAASVISILLFFSGWTEGIEAKTWDWRADFFAKPGKATEQICVILLNQESLDWASQENSWPWPWPRMAYAAIIDFLKRGEAASVALDVMFTEPSSYGPDDDQNLAKGCLDFGHVVVATGLSNESGSASEWPENLKMPDLSISGAGSQLLKEKLSKRFATFPLHDIASAFSIMANVDQNPDSDGIYRRVEPIKFFSGQPMPLLGFASFFTAFDNNKSVIIEKDSIISGRHKIPVDTDGKAVLRFRGKSGTHKMYSAAAIIRSEVQIRNGEKPQLDPSVFKGKHVFFGFSAKGLFDNKPVPVSEAYPGVEVNATFLDNLLSDDFIKKTPAFFDLFLVLILSCLCSFMLTFFNSPFKSLVFSAFFAALPAGLSFAAYSGGYWAPFVIPEISVVIAITLSLVVNFATEGVHKQFIKSAFQQYLPQAVIEEILKNPEKLTLGGEKKELSIFFSDLQGFTSISETLDPESLTALLNDYLTEMTDIVYEEGGTVDKYEGDAIIAFWNAPLDVPDHPYRAVRAAVRCQARLAELRPRYLRQTPKELFMRIGLNTGYAVVGNFGSKSRFNYTMLGDSVNLAARLEGVNKEFGTYTMVSGETIKKAGDGYFFRELGRVAVVGKKEAVSVYEPLEKADYENKKDYIGIFLKGLEAYYMADFDTAVSFFSEIKEIDPPAAKYIKKCIELKNQGINRDEWDGVWIMTSK